MVRASRACVSDPFLRWHITTLCIIWLTGFQKLENQPDQQSTLALLPWAVSQTEIRQFSLGR